MRTPTSHRLGALCLACLPWIATAQPAATERQSAPATDAITAGSKLTKADAARTAPAVPASDPTAQRGIEKKDIRRGMVIAKPGSITPHTRETAEPPCPPLCGDQAAPPAALETKHDTVKNSISNTR